MADPSSSFFEIGDLVREAVILALPLKPLCSGDCKGLCPVCGADLNRSQCDCVREKTDWCTGRFRLLDGSCSGCVDQGRVAGGYVVKLTRRKSYNTIQDCEVLPCGGIQGELAVQLMGYLGRRGDNHAGIGVRSGRPQEGSVGIW